MLGLCRPWFTIYTLLFKFPRPIYIFSLETVIITDIMCMTNHYVWQIIAKTNKETATETITTKTLRVLQLLCIHVSGSNY